MKLEIRYPTGSTHRVDLPGTLVSLGRDPSCDIVLTDAKCSRRHGVIEAGPSGLVVRDTGSANGVFLNGAKIERAALRDGDLVRMGEVIIKIIEEGEAGTVVVASEELAPLPPPPAARSHASLTTTEIAELPAGVIPRAGPPPQQVKTPPSPVGVPRLEGVPRVDSPPRPSVRAPAAAPPTAGPSGLQGPVPRPLTISVLAVLWALSSLAFAAGGLATAAALWGNGLLAGSAAALGLLLAAVGAALAFGLWSRSPWARPLQIVIAGLGILACPFLPAAATTLIYMLRAEVRAAFSGKQDLRDLPPAEAEALRTGPAETVFSLSILAMVLLGVIVTAVLAWFGTRTRPA